MLVDTGRTVGEAEASTNETARKPRPTAAAAEPVQADPRRRVLFMAGRFRPARLRRTQGAVKEHLRFSWDGRARR
jgi:hypothetical protein